MLGTLTSGPSPTLDAVEVIGSSGFSALEAEWNALVVANQNPPFYRHEFLRTWLAHFSPGANLQVLATRDGTGGLTAVFPLIRSTGLVGGIPARLAASPTNAHSCRFDVVADDGPLAARTLLDHLSADRSWDAIRIADVPENGNAWHLYRAAEDAGFPVGTWESQLSPYLPLPSSYEQLQETMTSRFRSNLRRRRRILEEMGTPSIERVTGGDDLPARLEECFTIERSGWKGREGTAIPQDEETHGFYTELAHAAAAREYLSLFLLRLDGKAIAFHYGLTYENVYYMPKVGYDEAFKKCSPGHLLLEEIVKDCISRGVSACDFLGTTAGWKTQWSEQTRRHDWLYIFRDSRFGQALHTAKFKLIPEAKRVWASWIAKRGADG